MDFDALIKRFDQITSLDEKERLELYRQAKVVKPGAISSYFVKFSTKISPLFLHWPQSAKGKLQLDQGDRRLYPWDIHGYSLRFHIPFFGLVECPWKSKCSIGFLVYVTIKFVIVFCTFLVREYRIYKWIHHLNKIEKETMQTNANNSMGSNIEINTNSMCFEDSNLNSIGRQLVASLDFLNQINYLIGSPIITFSLFYVYVILGVTAYICILFFMSFFNRNNPNLRQDALTVQYEPHIEKDRIDWQARQISKLIVRDTNENGQVALEDDTLARLYVDAERWHKISFRDLSCKENPKELSSSIKAHQIVLINPAYLTLAAFKKSIDYRFKFITLTVSLSAILGLTLGAGLIYGELESRVELRTIVLSCQTCFAGARSSKIWPAKLLPEPSGQQLARGYKPTMFSELIIGLNKQTILFTLEAILTYVICAFMSGTYFYLLFANRLLQDIWLSQLREQLELIRQMMLLAEIYQRYKTFNSFNLSLRQSIETCLYKAYLNLILFRRQLRYPHALFKFLLWHVVIMVIILLGLASFCLNSKGEKSVIYIWFSLLFGVFLLNVFGYLSVEFTSRFDQLNAHIGKLMVEAARLSMESSNIITLWRRQVMSSSEIEHAFGIEILGVLVSHSNIIQFDSYVFLATLYILRSYIT